MVAAPEQPKTDLIVPKRRRKITHFEVKEVAKLVSDSYLTEREACSVLEIPSRVWEQWKGRNDHKEQFEQLFTRLRAQSIQHSIKRISDCGDGIGLKQPDWRAKAHLLALADRERFGTDRRDSQPATNNVNLTISMSDSLKRVFDVPRQAIDLPDTKAIPAST